LKTKLGALLLATILLSGFLASTGLVREAKAPSQATIGNVCIADPTTANLGLTLNPKNVCPTSPGAIFNGPWTNATSPTPPQRSPTQIKVGVYINDSDPINGFGITLIANHNILAPIDANVSGSVLVGTPTVLVKCVAAVLIVGPTCDPVYDTVDTITFKVTGGLGQLTPIHTTGLLFTATYNITGHTLSSGISVNFQVGCTNTSVPGGVCITMSNGSNSPPTETAENGRFNNNTPPPFISISTNQTLIGPRTPPFTRNVTITATSQNGWPGFSTDSIKFITVSSPGLSEVVKGTNPCSAGATSCSVNVAITVTKAGSVTILAGYASVDPVSSQTTTLVAPVTVSAVIPDFTIVASPLSVGPLLPGAPGTSMITVAPIYGFTGDVTLATNAVSSGLTATMGTTIITGATGTSTLTVSASAVGNYSVRVQGTSGTLSHLTRMINVTVTIQISLTVASVTVSPTTGSVGVKVTFTIVINNTGSIAQLAFVNALVGNVTVKTQNVTLALGPSTTTLTWDTSGYAPGTYALGAKVIPIGSGKNSGNGVLTPATFTLTAAAPSGILEVLSQDISQNLPIVLLIIAIIIVAVVAIFLVLRQRSKTPSAL